MRVLREIAGCEVLMTFAVHDGEAVAAAHRDGQIIGSACWCLERGDDHRWHTLRTWRMTVLPEWRRRGVMTALWDLAKAAGYVVSVSEWSLSPYTLDGQAFAQSRRLR